MHLAVVPDEVSRRSLSVPRTQAIDALEPTGSGVSLDGVFELAATDRVDAFRAALAHLMVDGGSPDAFLDRRLRVKRVYHALAPFRLTSLVWGARSVLELAPGSLASTGTAVGDELQFSPAEDTE